MASRGEGFIGVDVHKDTLEVCVDEREKQWDCANDEAGVKALLTTLEALPRNLASR